MMIWKNIRSVWSTGIFLFVAHAGFSQTYSLSPGDSIVETTPFNDLYHFNIMQNNLTGDYLNFSWQQISASVPSGWQAFLCDNGYCFDNLPLSGTMDTVFAGDVGLMSIGINPFTIEGVAFIQYAVWEASTPEQIDTLTWIITAGTESAIHETKANVFNIFPNPANTVCSIQTDLQNGFEWRITDGLGKIILKGVSQNATCNILVQNIPSGINFISINNTNQILSANKLIINH